MMFTFGDYHKLFFFLTTGLSIRFLIALYVLTAREKMRLKSCQPSLQALILCPWLVVVKVKGAHQHHSKSQN